MAKTKFNKYGEIEETENLREILYKKCIETYRANKERFISYLDSEFERIKQEIPW